MKLVDEDPTTLDAIIVTHEHSDHVAGLAVTARKLGIPVYFTEATHRAWVRWLSPRKQMTYAQWLEQCRNQAAARMAEADAPDDEDCEPEEAESSQSGPAAQPSSLSESEVETAAKKRAGCEKDPTALPSLQYFQARKAHPDRRHLRQPLHHSPRRRRSSRFRLPGRGCAHGCRHRPRLHSAKRKSAAQRR